VTSTGKLPASHKKVGGRLDTKTAFDESTGPPGTEKVPVGATCSFPVGGGPCVPRGSGRKPGASWLYTRKSLSLCSLLRGSWRKLAWYILTHAEAYFPHGVQIYSLVPPCTRGSVTLSRWSLRPGARGPVRLDAVRGVARGGGGDGPAAPQPAGGPAARARHHVARRARCRPAGRARLRRLRRHQQHGL